MKWNSVEQVPKLLDSKVHLVLCGYTPDTNEKIAVEGYFDRTYGFYTRYSEPFFVITHWIPFPESNEEENEKYKSVIKFQLDECAMEPRKAHDSDAGFDLFSPVDALLEPMSSIVIDTGVHFEIPEGVTGFVKSRSGLNVVHDIVSEGVIDSGYIGSVKIKLYNHGQMPYEIHRGDRISQIVFLPLYPACLIEYDCLNGGERGNHGFGSSGR